MTILFVRTSTYEHRRLEKKVVEMKTTGIHLQHNTRH